MAFISTFIIAQGSVFLVSIYFLNRNNRVFKERGRVMDIVYESDNWEQRRKEYHNVSYNEMIWKFWKPVKSFYKKTFPEI